MFGRLLVMAVVTAMAEEVLEASDCDADAALELAQLRARKQETSLNEIDESDPDHETFESGNVSEEDCLGIFLAAQPDYNQTYEPELESSSSLGHSGHIRTLYHQTSRSAGPQILRGGFRRGHIGWCGGGIYFALSAGATYHKAVGVDSAHGFIIEARVDLGRTKHMPAQCTSSRRCWGIPLQNAIRCIDHSYQGGHFQGQGYNSIYFNPGDGGEYVIWDPRRVISMRRVR
ncbi:unnamed protein product [Symbiodinium sp. CCMP2456]|nr:unnamed protein product [Symbiodinium sp. CCMP2456]